MEYFLEILTKPDNIPIVFMLILIAFFLWLGLKQAVKHDRMIEKGEKDKVYDEMMK